MSFAAAVKRRFGHLTNPGDLFNYFVQVRIPSFKYLLEHLDKEYPLDDISAQLGSIIPAFNDSGYHLARVDEVRINIFKVKCGSL